MLQAVATPLYVDLDGTLVNTDLLVESAVQFVARHPFQSPLLVAWLMRGKATLKAELAHRVALDPASLPYNQPFLAHLRLLAEQGVPLYLATAANEKYAYAVAAHLGIFRGVIASDAIHSLSGLRKLQAIQQATQGGFIYAGNAQVDLPIWEASAGAIVVNASPAVRRKVEARGLHVIGSFEPPAPPSLPHLRALRPHQWLKNLLVFLPILPIAGSQALAPMLAQALWAFVAFSLCASAVYLINDLADLAPDRAHPRKRQRPFAAGHVPLQFGVLAAPLLLLAAAALALSLGLPFALALATYFALTSAYTLGLKRYPLIDVISLAMLYTLRVLGGAAAIQVVPSFWILAFSMFLFFSLALAKRYVELDGMRAANRLGAAGRGYRTGDMPLLQTMGVASGYLAVLVVAFYINSPDVTGRYGHAAALWCLCPLLLLWVSRVWLKAVRSEMHDDPLVFALKDTLSLLITGAAVLVMLAAIVI